MSWFNFIFGVIFFLFLVLETYDNEFKGNYNISLKPTFDEPD